MWMWLTASFNAKGETTGAVLEMRMMQKNVQTERFFPALLEEVVTPAFLGDVSRKFHFDEGQLVEIRKVAEELLPVLRKEAFWARAVYLSENLSCAEISGAEEEGAQSALSSSTYEKAAMSLGHGVDLLQESYSEKGLLLQSYIVEALAGELLMRGYDAYNRYIAAHTDRHVARYHFPGSEEALPLKMLSELLKDLTREITCNAAFCMIPKKSVVFISELTQDESVRCQGLCVGCGNAACPNRVEENPLIRRRVADMPLTYGYSRIFGIYNELL